MKKIFNTTCLYEIVRNLFFRNFELQVEKHSNSTAIESISGAGNRSLCQYIGQVDMCKWYNILVLIILFISCNLESKDYKNINTDNHFYTCSMHPQIIEVKAGLCPICFMDLVKVLKNSIEDNVVLLSDEQIKYGNIKVDTVRIGDLTDEIETSGILDFDRNKISVISSRIEGRIDKLYYRQIGEYIIKGSPIYKLYSEELNSAIHDYLLTITKKNTFNNSININFEKIVESAKNKLLLWGLSDNQINNLKNNNESGIIFYAKESGYITSIDAFEGDYLMEGMPLYTLAQLTSLWAEAQLYNSQISFLNSNETVYVRIPELNNLEIKSKIALANPELVNNNITNTIRIEIPNKSNMLKPGMPVYIVFRESKFHTIYLPSNAIIRDKKISSVWVMEKKGKFRNKKIRIGSESNGQTEILSGIDEGDMVVSSGAYLIHSEYIFKNGKNPTG